MWESSRVQVTTVIVGVLIVEHSAHMTVEVYSGSFFEGIFSMPAATANTGNNTSARVSEK